VTATLTLFCDIVAATRAETRQRAAEEREGRKRAPEDQRAAASGHIEESPARGGGAKVLPLLISPPVFFSAPDPSHPAHSVPIQL
jgi:hypothetical protein